MATALVTGLVDQQVSNDPGGDRWIRLIDESIDMFLAHCQPDSAPRTPGARTSPGREPDHDPMTTIDVTAIEPLTHNEAMRLPGT